MQPCYLEGISCIALLETRWLPEFQQVMGLEQQNIFFDGDESNYELWEVKFLGYLTIQHLHQTVLSPTDQSEDIDLIVKRMQLYLLNLFGW